MQLGRPASAVSLTGLGDAQDTGQTGTVRVSVRASRRGQCLHWRVSAEGHSCLHRGPAGGRDERQSTGQLRPCELGRPSPPAPGQWGSAPLVLTRSTPSPLVLGPDLHGHPWSSGLDSDWVIPPALLGPVPLADGRPQTSWPPQSVRPSLRNLLLYICLSPWLCFPGDPPLEHPQKESPMLRNRVGSVATPATGPRLLRSVSAPLKPAFAASRSPRSRIRGAKPLTAARPRLREKSRL